MPSAQFLELGPMALQDGAELLEKWLRSAGRRLAPEEERQAIRAGFTLCSLPLYLRLAFEEAQRWHSYDHPSPPSPDVDGLIERLFRQLSDQLHHDPLLVARAVSYLRCSRYGLTEDEILDLLARDDEYWAKFLSSAQHALPVTDGQQTRRLPIAIWSRLYHDLEPYLSWRSADEAALIVFFHTRFNEVADRYFLHDENIRRARHDRLATHFRFRADPGADGAWAGSRRAVAEVVHHMVMAGLLGMSATGCCCVWDVQRRLSLASIVLGSTAAGGCWLPGAAGFAAGKPDSVIHCFAVESEPRDKGDPDGWGRILRVGNI